MPRTPIVAKPGDNIINCACNLTFDHPTCAGRCEANFELELCLPPELRLAPNTDMGSAASDGGTESYAERLNDYCSQEIANAGYHLIKVFSGGWCAGKAPYAPNGGRGKSLQCFAHEFTTGHGDATRFAAGACPEVCPAVKCNYYTNCGEGVLDDFGNVNIDQCKCSQVIDAQCPGDPPSDLPSVVFCRPNQPAAPQ